jgi:hypothetical protein
MANVTFTLGNFPANFCWVGPQDFANNLIAILTGTVATAGKIIIGPSAPSPTDQDGVWYRTSGGYLEGQYLYLGGWFRPHPVPPSSQSRIIWTDTEAALWSYDGGDGTNPVTTPPTATTGAMWQRDLNFGADDGSQVFRVPVGIGTNPTAYDGNAARVIGVGATGGEERHIQIGTEVGPHTHNTHRGLVEHGAADTAVFQNTTSDGQSDVPTISGGGNPASGTPPVTALSHENMMPWRGVIFAKRTVRAYIQGT